MHSNDTNCIPGHGESFVFLFLQDEDDLGHAVPLSQEFSDRFQEQTGIRFLVVHQADALTGQGVQSLGRRISGLLFAAYAWALFLVLSAGGAAVLLLIPRRQGRRWARTVARALVRLSGVPVSVEGLERFAGALPAVVVANHCSYADSVVLTALLPAELRFAAKRELAEHPAAGPLLRRIGVRFVERFSAQQAIEDAREIAAAVARGESAAKSGRR